MSGGLPELTQMSSDELTTHHTRPYQSQTLFSFYLLQNVEQTNHVQPRSITVDDTGKTNEGVGGIMVLSLNGYHEACR